MGTLYGLDYFKQLQYRVVHKAPDHTLVISARGKRTGTDYLRLGLSLSDDMRGDSAFNLGASYRVNGINRLGRSEEHTSELQSLMRISYAVFCLKKKKTQTKSTASSMTQHQNKRT